MRSVAIILAGGRGKRMQSAIPKQYLPILGKPLLAHTLCAFEKSAIDEIVLVAGIEEFAYIRKEMIEPFGLHKVKAMVEGGNERYDSVYNGLKAVRERKKTKMEEIVVLVHDGARACVLPDTINTVIEAAIAKKACIAAVPVKDTIKISMDGQQVMQTPKREQLWAVQTPQGFWLSLLWEANAAMYALKEKDAESFARLSITDDACIVEQFTDQKIAIVLGDYTNLKVTTPEDLILAEAFLQKRA